MRAPIGKPTYVTTLNDSGLGSLRDACEETYPRRVVFRVGGEIRLKTAIRIRNPHLWLWGNVPVTLRGWGLHISTSDVSIGNIAIRPGFTSPTEWDKDCITVDNAARVEIEHCELSESIDELLGISNAVDVHVSNCILSDACAEGHPQGDHSMACLVGPNSDRVTLRENWIRRCNTRMPQLSTAGRVDVVNNIIEDWRDYATVVRDGCKANIVGNVYRPTPRRTAGRGEIRLMSIAYCADNMRGIVCGPDGRTLSTGLMSPWDGPIDAIESKWVEEIVEFNAGVTR